ncbi:fluoride efflux transporter CrcB, partial [Xanthomonas oryzae]
YEMCAQCCCAAAKFADTLQTKPRRSHVTPIYTIAAISLGASLGALARYGLGLALNAIFPPLPIGTLAANLIAAYVVGVTIAYVGTVPGLSPLWRLFMITGLAGGLSTFSTFTAELFSLLREGRLGMSAGMLGLHVGGSLALLMLGMLTIGLLRKSSLGIAE